MNKRKIVIFIIIPLIAGAVSFLNARITALNKQNQTRAISQSWLVGIPPTVAETEAKFNNEADGLIANLQSLQKSLAAALEDPCTPDAIVLERVDDVIVTHEHLIRRIGKHVIELRHNLSERNREYLMQLCAEAVRGPMSRLGARMGGQGYGHGRRGGTGRGYGYRGGTGHGAGVGSGQHLRFRTRLANRLRLTSEQMTLLQENDPNFESESMDLYNAIIVERQKLLSVFENPESGDNELMQQIDSCVSVHSQIERRIAEHVLILRPYLTVEQQKWLIGLCRRFHTN